MIFFAAKQFMQNGEYGSLIVEKDVAQVSPFYPVSFALCTRYFISVVAS